MPQQQALADLEPWRTGVDIDATPTYPAAYSNKNMMTVIATDQNDVLAGYSNVGAKLTDVAAPGSKILSTILHGQVRRTALPFCVAGHAVLQPWSRTLLLGAVAQDTAGPLQAEGLLRRQLVPQGELMPATCTSEWCYKMSTADWDALRAVQHNTMALLVIPIPLSWSQPAIAGLGAAAPSH